MLLIHPPGARVCEPFSGIGRLAGALSAAGRPFRVWDVSLEGILWLAEQAEPPLEDAWGRRAVKNRARTVDALTGPGGYGNFERYKQLVGLLGRLLPSHARGDRWDITPSNYADRVWDPLEPANLIAAASHPEENPYYPWFSRRLPELMPEGAPGEVGISFTFLSQALTGMALAGFLRREYPGVKIRFGGGLITSWVRRFGRLPFLAPWADGITAGAGEDAVAPGRNPAAPSHDYSFVRDLSYFSPGLVLPFSASLGCPWRRCTFCPERAERNPFQSLGIDRSVREMAALAEEYRPVLIHLTDSEISPALLTALAASGGIGAEWYGFCRFTPLLEDRRFCRSLAASGCRMLCLGLESADRKVLEAMKKGIDLERVPRILENLKEAGIGTFVYLLFGTPEEDRDAALRTRDFTAAHAGLMDFINPSIFNYPVEPSAGSGENEADSSYGSVGARGVPPSLGLHSAPLSLYRDFIHPLGWDRPRVRRFLAEEFRGTPEIRRILRRTPPVFTSNHAPFFLP